MGKQSKRKEKKTNEQTIVYQGKNVKMPPNQPGWKTYTQANRELEKMGYRECMIAPDFSPEELIDAIGTLLEKKDMLALNATDVVPEGPNADWSTWPFAGFELRKRASEVKNTAFLVLRTKQNTAGFLGGNLYGLALRLGGMQAAIEHVSDSSTPCGMLMLHKQTLILPTAVMQGSPKLAARIIVAMMERDEKAFSCCVCLESLIRVDGTDANDQILLKGFVAADCDHAFHPGCIMGHIRSGGQSCPMCRGPLPVTLADAGFSNSKQTSQPELSDELRWSGESIGRLDPRNPQDRPAIMNALADRVRNAMIEDGLDPPTDAQRFQ